MNTDVMQLPATWASALINGDESGLDEDERKILHAWYAGNPGVNVTDCSGEPYFFFDVGDGSGDAGMVLDYTVEIGGE